MIVDMGHLFTCFLVTGISPLEKCLCHLHILKLSLFGFYCWRKCISEFEERKKFTEAETGFCWAWSQLTQQNALWGMWLVVLTRSAVGVSRVIKPTSCNYLLSIWWGKGLQPLLGWSPEAPVDILITSLLKPVPSGAFSLHPCPKWRMGQTFTFLVLFFPCLRVLFPCSLPMIGTSPRCPSPAGLLWLGQEPTEEEGWCSDRPSRWCDRISLVWLS